MPGRAWWQDEDYIASHYEPDEAVDPPRATDMSKEESDHLWGLCTPDRCSYCQKEGTDGGTT